MPVTSLDTDRINVVKESVKNNEESIGSGSGKNNTVFSLSSLYRNGCNRSKYTGGKKNTS